jgi:exodeoxyribonuclease III
MTHCFGRRCGTAVAALVAQRWTDALRALHPGERIYTFPRYFWNAFGRDAGLRIDHLLLSPPLARRLAPAGVDRDVRDRERASDHAPVDRSCRANEGIAGPGARSGKRRA